jgi:hypothetical protein
MLFLSKHFAAALIASVRAAASLPSSLNYTELGDASFLFSGPLEVAVEDPEFQWLESPARVVRGRTLFAVE